MLKRFFCGSALLCLSALVVAHEYSVGQLEIKHPWARESASAASNAGVFMVIHSAADDQLLQASSDAASKVEIHEMKMSDGVMKMRPINAVTLPKGGVTKLAPGSYHIMLLGLKKPLKKGERFPMTLTFAKAGKTTVDVKVEDMTYQAASSSHEGH
ncbi:copper chaperone PCu(A)C [Chitinibacter sp. SCUT-21]|uniref:copper chaperone PCu(A)C n=1 Tax=Chitinibacter sp. SCUT-21 TaxID=2970891 RepID=UPI0035A726D4